MFLCIDDHTADGCPIDYNNPRYSWPEASLTSGEAVRVPCPCASVEPSLNNKEATRICGGNFSSGIRWLSADTSQCLLTNELSNMLCTTLMVRS